eukprot:scaffold139636_cov187-Phaeocystis_antarctica.AAC.1
MCGNYPDAEVTNAQPPIYTAPTDPKVYAFKRGEHREKINVHAGDLGKCIGELYGGVIAREKRDTIAAWLNTGKDCGETLVENGLVDRDLGGSDAANDNDGRMKSFINTYMADTAANGCSSECDSDDNAGSNIYAQACAHTRTYLLTTCLPQYTYSYCTCMQLRSTPEVNVDDLLKNFAAYAVTVGTDSPIGDTMHNFFLASSGGDTEAERAYRM